MDIRVAVIEDSDDAFFAVKEYLAEYSKKTAYNFNITRFEYSESFLENYKPVYDIVIMDIMLPGMNGMDAAVKLRQLDPIVVLIFVTNMSQYAINGYQVDALDYVLKPINYYSFIMRIEKALRRISKSADDKLLRLRTENGVRLAEVSEIYLIDILRHYITVHTSTEKIRSYGVLNDIEVQLPKTFVRCSACAIVNLKCVEGIYSDDIKLKNGVTVHIGRTRKKEFMMAFSKYIIGGALS